MTTSTLYRHSPFPYQPTKLVGRENEIDDILKLLDLDEVRLVTLTGPGGIGKTRLALEVGQRLYDRYHGSVRVVFLDALDDPRLVLWKIAQELNVSEGDYASPRDGLLEAMGNRPWLLVLDNFERLGPAAPDIAWLLANVEQLKMLVTSRIRMRIQGEYEFITLPLALPDTGGQTAIDQNPAVQLFLQNARSVTPELTLDGPNGSAIAAICRQLDGIPLAIELAAARSKVLPPDAILSRLDRRLPLLTGGPRDLPDRLRTMRDAIAWSYELLSEDERALFRRLCVFAGTFSLLEAMAVGVSGGEASSDIEAEVAAIDMLSVLVDNSLIRQHEATGEPRFSILGTIREFGVEALASSGELNDARHRHAAYFVELAEAGFPRLRGADRLPWLIRLDEAYDNLQSALLWLCQTSNAPSAVQLAGALWRYWWWRSRSVDGRRQLEQALALPGASDQGARFARALTGCGALAETMGDYERASRYHEEALSIWNVLDDQDELAHALLFRWLVALNIDDEERMAALAMESHRLFRLLGDPWGIATSQLELGVVAMLRGDGQEGERVLLDAIDGFTALSDGWGVAMSEGVLGNIKAVQGDNVSAGRYLQQSLDRLLLLGDIWGVATVLLSIARSAAEQGNHELVVRVSGSIGNLHEAMGALVKVPFRARYQQNLDDAERHLGREKYLAILAEGAALSPSEAVEAAFALTPAPSYVQTPSSSLLSLLSPREREVLRLIPGRTAKEIGEALFISESTVRTHIEHILNKLGMRNQKELVALIYEKELLG